MSLSISNLLDLPIGTLEPASPVSVETGTALSVVIEKLQRHRIGCVLVTQDNRLEGIITERDLSLKVLGCGVDINSAIVDDFMTIDPECLQLYDPIAFAMNRMNLGGFRHVPLVDKSMRPVGIISVKDIVTLLVDEFPSAVMNLPPEPRIYPAAREGA